MAVPKASTFTYGLGNPLQTKITKPGQTLPTTKKVVPKAAVDSKEVKAVKDAAAGVETASTASDKAIQEYFETLRNPPIVDNSGAGSSGLTYDQQLALQKQQQDADKALAESQKKTLAIDTFRATLGLIFGKDEAAKAYVSKLYDLTSGFYKSGSTVEEAMNLALYQAENDKVIPEFTTRFKGIFALRDAKQAGAALQVPTIAEFFATEAKMGEVLRTAGLGDLATETFLGDIIGRQKSVNEVASLISDVFNTIDYAPAELKQTLSTYFPGVDRVSLAKAILTGPEGAQALSQKIKGVSVISAGQQYGMAIDMPTAMDIANRGYGYGEALTGFKQVSSLSRAGDLARIENKTFTQQQAQDAIFKQDSANLSQIAGLKEREEARFASQTGAMKGSFSTKYLSQSSSAGQF
jgi:hypothetical protein